MEPVVCKARAKLNLFLHIVGRRDDGYHLLESLVGFAKIGDAIAAWRASSMSLSVEGPFASALADTAPAENLVLKAAEGLADWVEAEGERRPGARLVLSKNLPVASGIGGGSADAAAALLALRRLWRVDIGDHDLAGLGLALGADIPACLSGAPAILRGIGGMVEPVASLPEVPLVLVNPGLPVPTPLVYRRFAADTPEIESRVRPAPAGPWSSVEALAADLRATANDLEPPSIALCPPIGDVLAALRQQTGVSLARMSGSGATCFALCASSEAAQGVAVSLAKAFPRWWVVATTLDAANGLGAGLAEQSSA